MSILQLDFMILKDFSSLVILWFYEIVQLSLKYLSKCMMIEWELE